MRAAVHAPLDPMERLKLGASMLRHRAAHAPKHYGRERAKFQFDLVVQAVENLPDTRSGSASVLVSCARGPKIAVTTEAEPVQSKASWNEKISFVCTLYDAADKGERRWAEKEYRLSVQLVSPGEFGTHKRKLSELAFTQLDVSQYASAAAVAAAAARTGSGSTELTLRLGWTGKPLCYALLRLALSCTLVRATAGGGHSTSDARSISSDLSEEQQQPHAARAAAADADGMRRAAAARSAAIGQLSSIRESLATRLHAGSARKGRGASRSASGLRGGDDDDDDDDGQHRGRPGHDRAPTADGSADGGAAGAAGLWARDGAPADGPAHGARSVPERATMYPGSPTSSSEPATRAAGRAAAGGAPLPAAPVVPPALAAAAAEERAAARAHAERLVAQLAAADAAARSAEAESELLREQLHALTLAVHEAQAAATPAARADERADGGGALGEQLRVSARLREHNDALRGALAEAEAGRADAAKELERAEHVGAKLRLALAHARRRGGGGGGGGGGGDDGGGGTSGSASPRSSDGGDVERTELQLALVDAKLQLATVQYEKEEATHELRALRHELERSAGGSLKVAKEMTWLEVKYTEARAELARVKAHAVALEDDLREVIALKLELAEAQQRIAELEAQRADGY
ncbi:hypothetical protein KFE25_001418 [Diacronema lutheri]|uniref:C2 NT-type domain-containing protein n=2 Tax=Diacronema lutheri TaxID=2081491 RepID=A0A8J5XMK2_DIALT|nr:hypothetical protein KFE25_001418 [Diacronema lutheri]